MNNGIDKKCDHGCHPNEFSKFIVLGSKTYNSRNYF